MGGLPVWWVPRHDVELVAGVLEHGFGVWADILLDPRHSFRAAAAEHEAKVGSADDDAVWQIWMSA